MEKQTDNRRKKWGFRQFTLLGFFVVLAAIAVAAVSLRGFWPAPQPQAAEQGLAQTPAPAAEIAPAAQEPQAEPQPEQEQQPTQTEAPAQLYVRTAVLADGKVLGVLASREAAEELLSDVLEHYLGMVTEPGEPTASFVNEVTLEIAPEPEGEAQPTVTHDEMLALLTGEDSPVDVQVLLQESTVEKVPFEQTEEKDKYLVKGTRIVVSLGVEGEQTTTVTTTYINGEKKGKPQTETVVTREAQNALVRVGAEKVTDSTPDKKQGKKGPETEVAFSSPLEDGSVVSNFGQRGGVLHLGLDYKAEAGAEVLSAADGVVAAVMERGGYGLMVEIDHGEGFSARYAHLESVAVSVGQSVLRGEAIGVAGLSGNAEAELEEDERLLHFELRILGEAYNPRYYLD